LAGNAGANQGKQERQIVISPGWPCIGQQTWWGLPDVPARCLVIYSHPQDIVDVEKIRPINHRENPQAQQTCLSDQTWPEMLALIKVSRKGE